MICSAALAHARGWVLLLLAVTSVLGCEARRAPKAGEKLEREAETRIQNARVRAPLGARGRASAVIALVDQPEGCDRVERARGEAFFVCLWPHAEFPMASRLRGVLHELKKSFPEHIAAGPVSLFAQAGQVGEAMNLAAEEPSFFAGLVLEGPDRLLVSNARLYSYGQKGGRRVALIGVSPEEVQRARSAASAGHLAVETFPASPEGLSAALRFARTERGGLAPPTPDFVGSSQGG